MSVPRIIKGVLWNFLGTYMSRYSAFNGYWLFGFLVPIVEYKEIDLLSSHLKKETPWAVAASLAEAKFTDQLEKAHIARSELRSALLRFTKSSDACRQSLHCERTGYTLTCQVEVTLQDDSPFAVERAVFVAPHDPSIEAASYSE